MLLTGGSSHIFRKKCDHPLVYRRRCKLMDQFLDQVCPQNKRWLKTILTPKSAFSTSFQPCTTLVCQRHIPVMHSIVSQKTADLGQKVVKLFLITPLCGLIPPTFALQCLKLEAWSDSSGSWLHPRTMIDHSGPFWTILVNLHILLSNRVLLSLWQIGHFPS